MAVPFADLQLQYQTIKGEIDGAIANVIRDNAFIRGPYVDAFEREFAAAAEVEALRLLRQRHRRALSRHGGAEGEAGRRGDHHGAFLDLDLGDDHPCRRDAGVLRHRRRRPSPSIPRRSRRRSRRARSASFPVHLYGQPADMDAIMAIADKHKLWVIEDCAQAHLARYKGKQIGTFGAAATYSFYPGKNLGAMGDAGAVVTNDAALAEHMTMLARHGGLVKHQHQIEGINSRLDGMQAAILSAKLPHLPAWTKARQDAAKVYDAGLNQIEDVVVPEVAPDRTHVYHLYTIRHPRRDELVEASQRQWRADRGELSDRAAVPCSLWPLQASPGAVPERPCRPGPDPVAADVCRDHARAAGRGDRAGAGVLTEPFAAVHAAHERRRSSRESACAAARTKN